MQTWKNQTIGAYKKTNDEILSQALEDGYLLVDGDETVLKLNLTSEDGRKVLCDDDRVPLAQSKHQEQVTFFGMITSDGGSLRPVVVRKRTSGIHFEHYGSLLHSANNMSTCPYKSSTSYKTYLSINTHGTVETNKG